LKGLYLVLVTVFSLCVFPYFAMALDTTDLVLYMSLDEGRGSTATDLSGSGNDGVAMGGATWVSGNIGGGLQLSAPEDFIEVPDSASLDITDKLTLAIWANIEALPDGSCALFMKPTAYMLHTTTGGDGVKVDPLIFVNGSYGGWPTPVNVSAPLGEWHHYAATYDDGKYAIYVDGELIDGYDREVSGNIDNDDNPLAIGRDNRDCCNTRNSPCIIDEAMVWSRALNEAEVEELSMGNLTAVGPGGKLGACWGEIKRSK
jgi:hypothetical protein